MDGTQDRRRLVGRQEVPGISIFGDHPATGVRRRKGALAACLACVLPAAAQLTVEVDLQQQQFLPGESLPVAVRITNLSGQPLRLGEEEDWLSFSVEAEDQRVVRRFGEPVLREPFRLESSQRATVRVDLAPYYDLSRQGRYRVQATVRVLAWDREFSSLPVDFFIITGARLWEREFGLPGSDAGRPPEMRKYILQEANYLKRNLRLYLRITDPTETQIIRVVPLGPIVSFGQPQPQLDSASNLHLLFQNGRSTFVYHVINPDGEIMVRETYEIAGSRPRLGMDATGRITVVGGQRRYAADDVPPSLSGRGPRAVGQDDSPRRASDD
ncbi:MAG: hypothetical protein RMN51_08090 [Verrucomicrobiota bacterium]|nr:arrestin family protein [Limisphaera sp.]MDW8382048.1 hypothetical protein [Verrucomicrobiota bacterium]